MMYGYGDGYGAMMGGGGVLFQLLLFVLTIVVIAGVVLLIYLVIKSASNGQGAGTSGPGGQSPESPLHAPDEACAIARKRYALGEITKEQYEEICKTLVV